MRRSPVAGTSGELLAGGTVTGEPGGAAPRLQVEFCGEWYDIERAGDFHIGRQSGVSEADLAIDDNPFLHRRFLRIYEEFGLWWLANVGTLLSATVTDATGAVQAWLAPGAKLPIVFHEMVVLFSAGSTTYELTIHSAEDYYNTRATLTEPGGNTAAASVVLTPSQRLLIIALAEKVLRQTTPGRGEVPTSAEAAERLHWSMTTFNRKLDNVCDKLDKVGVAGLRGGKGNVATNRRQRLIEYAVATRLIGAEDLVLLDGNDAEHAPGEAPLR